MDNVQKHNTCPNFIIILVCVFIAATDRPSLIFQQFNIISLLDLSRVISFLLRLFSCRVYTYFRLHLLPDQSFSSLQQSRSVTLCCPMVTLG
jgi:hypothetical protein